MKPACPVHHQQWDALAQLCVWVCTAWFVKKFGLMSSRGAAESHAGRSVQGPVIKAYTKQGPGSQSAAHGSRPGAFDASTMPLLALQSTHIMRGPWPHAGDLTYPKRQPLHRGTGQAGCSPAVAGAGAETARGQATTASQVVLPAVRWFQLTATRHMRSSRYVRASLCPARPLTR